MIFNDDDWCPECEEDLEHCTCGELCYNCGQDWDLCECDSFGEHPPAETSEAEDE